MGNHHLAGDWLSVVVILANVAGCVAAMTVAWIAAIRVQGYRLWLASTVLLSTAYAVGYLALVFVDIEPGDWSRSMRWLGVAAWPLVWVWPQLRLLRATARLAVMEGKGGPG